MPEELRQSCMQRAGISQPFPAPALETACESLPHAPSQSSGRPASPLARLLLQPHCPSCHAGRKDGEVQHWDGVKGCCLLDPASLLILPWDPTQETPQ